MKRVPWKDNKNYQSGDKRKEIVLICPKCGCNVIKTLMYKQKVILKHRIQKIVNAREEAIKKLDRKNKER